MQRSPRDVLRLLEVQPDGPGDLSVTLLGVDDDEGRLEVDCHDPEQAFEVIVRRRPRRTVPVPPNTVVGHVDEVPVELVAVVVGVRVEITLDCPTGGVGSPTWPGELVWRQLRMTLRDDAATPYRLSSGEAGGKDHPWRVRQCFVPTPPAGATALSLEGTSLSDGSSTRVTVPLVGAD